MLISVASTDGETVNEHFGRAARFLIYEVAGTVQSLVVVREVEPLTTGDRNHPFNEERMAAVIDALKGCERVYCTKIGDRPRQELAKAGITPVLYDGAISSIRS